MKPETIELNAAFCAPEKTGELRVKFSPLYSGGECDVDGFDGPAVADIETLELDSDPPALVDHEPDWIAGRLENIEIKKDEEGRSYIDCEAVIGGTPYAKAVQAYFSGGPVALKPSIGIKRIRDYNIEYYGPGETVQVNGRTFRGPVNIIRHGHLSEGSFVTQAGDPEARAFLAKLKHNGGTTTMTFEEFLAGKGIEPGAFEAMSDEEKEALRAEFAGAGGEAAEAGLEDGEGGGEAGDGAGEAENAVAEAAAEAAADEITKAVEGGEITAEEGDKIFDEIVGEVEKELEAECGGDEDKEMKASARRIAEGKVKGRVFRARIKAKNHKAVDEHRRQSAIKTFCASFGRKGAEIAGRAIAEGWSYGKTEKVMKASMKSETKLGGLHRNIPAGGGNSNGSPRPQDVMTAAFGMTCKLKPEFIQKHFGFSDNVMNAAMARENRNVTLRRLLVDSVNSFQSNYANAGTNLMEIMPALRQFCRQRKERELTTRNFNASLGFSTISATDVLHAIISAYLADQPTAAAPFYKTITKEVSFSDFNSVDAYLPTLIGQLSKISETGQIEHVGYTTQKISAKTEPLGATFAIPEMVLINDQLNVFVELLQQFRDLPEKCVEHDVAEYFWRMVDGDINAADGSAFFSTSRGNIITGAGTALSEAGLNAATEALDSQADENGAPLSGDGAFIVTSSALFATAQRLYASENINVIDTIGEKNVYAGVYKPYKWAYLNSGLARAKKDDGSTNSDLQTYKATQWYLFRDPQRRPIMTVNKLVGYESPQIKQFDSDPSTWGTVYQLIYPYSISAAWTDGALVCRGA